MSDLSSWSLVVKNRRPEIRIEWVLKAIERMPSKNKNLLRGRSDFNDTQKNKSRGVSIDVVNPEKFEIMDRLRPPWTYNDSSVSRSVLL